ncbi:MAG: glycosyltransferase [Lachnospiraceae bacterium]|nr:glycosyltransferase [Lachnospiraceae bacterium]
MRVLIINLRIGTGSVGRIVSDLYQGIIESGNECKVAYARGGIGSISKQDTYKICSENEVRLHAALTRLFGNTAFYFSSSTQKLCKWISEYDPDIIHLHGVYGYYLNMEILFNYMASSRAYIVSTLHSCWDFTGHCCYFDYINCAQWKTGCKKCRAKGSYPKSSFLDNTKKNYEKKKEAYRKLERCEIVTPSIWLSNYLRDSFLKEKKHRVIYNGIDLSSFKALQNKSRYVEGIDKPIILCIASIWERRKGWEDVVELSFLLPSKYQLVVVGTSQKQSAELHKNVITITRTDNKEELAELYSSATVLFNPTYEDNYPTVNLEAIACHTPVVTYQTGGSPEALKKATWGVVIEKKDFTGLMKYVDTIYESADYITDEDLQVLSKKHMVEQYLDLYKELVEDIPT